MHLPLQGDGATKLRHVEHHTIAFIVNNNYAMAGLIKDNSDSSTEEYDIIVKDSNDILNEINFSNDNDALIMKTIISNMERDIANELVKGHTVAIPFIGRVWKNPARELLRPYKKELFENSKYMSREEYIEECKKLFGEVRKELDYLDFVKGALKRIKMKNKVKYDKYFLSLGKTYADMYIKSIYWLSYVPYDQEVQDQFDRLKD